MEAVLAQRVNNVRRCSTRAGVLPFHQLGEGRYGGLGMPYASVGYPQLSDDAAAGLVSVCKEAGMDVRLHGD